MGAFSGSCSSYSKVPTPMCPLNTQGDWAQRFPAASTKPETFHLLDKREALVQMMHLEGQFRVASIQRLDSQILELPFKGGRLSLIIILPNERYGLKNVEVCALPLPHCPGVRCLGIVCTKSLPQNPPPPHTHTHTPTHTA